MYTSAILFGVANFDCLSAQKHVHINNFNLFTDIISNGKEGFIKTWVDVKEYTYDKGLRNTVFCIDVIRK